MAWEKRLIYQPSNHERCKLFAVMESNAPVYYLPPYLPTL